MDKTFLIIIPVAILYAIYIVFFFRDIQRKEVKYFSKPLWFIVCLISVPLGGIIYFLIGRKEDIDDEKDIDRIV